MSKRDWGRRNGNVGGLYFLGVIGAMVWYIQHAHGFWSVVLAILEAFVWPALVVYHILNISAG